MYVVLYAFFNMLTLKRRKELNLFYLVIVVFTIIHLYFLSWDNTSYTPSETLSTTTGIFIPNIDKTEFASDEDFTMADRYTQCKRKDHVAYIKTHKTGSTLMANMIWRWENVRSLIHQSVVVVYAKRMCVPRLYVDLHIILELSGI